MFSLNKKGVSGVITILVLTLASIAGAGIIYTSLQGSINTLLSPQLACTELQLSPPIEITEACINSEGNLQVSINRELGSELSDITFNVNTQDQSYRYVCGLACGVNCILPKEGQTKTYYLYPEEIPTTIATSISNCQIDTRQIPNC